MNALTLAQKGLGNLFGVSPQSLLAELKIFKESIVKTDYEHGVAVATYEVAAQDLAAALSGESLNSGLLPPDTLFYERKGISERIAIYVPPARRTLRLGKWYTFPSPALVFMGEGRKYHLFAVKGRPHNLNKSSLYKAPFPNVGLGGLICHGDAGFPICTKGTIHEALKVFFESNFTTSYTEGKSKKHTLILDAYLAYKDNEAWPVDDLIRYRSVKHIVGGTT
jgi:PRTRC genetic system protein B